MTEGKYSAEHVALYFIGKQKPGNRHILSNLKLQKLLYYAQGFYFAEKGVRLFPDELLAYPKGPVVLSVHLRFSAWNFHNLDVKTKILPSLLKSNDRLFLDGVWALFEDCSAKELETVVMLEEPWQQAIGRRNQMMKLEDIGKYFQMNYPRNRQ